VDPEFPWPLSQLGLLAERRGRLDDAADYLKQSTMIDHSRPSHYLYGVLLLNMKRYDEAEQELELSLRVSPSHLGTIIARVFVAYLRGDKEEATRRFNAAWAKYGASYPNAFVGLMGGREAQLRDLMTRWDDGNLPTNAATRSKAYMVLGEYDAAIDWLIRAIDDGSASPFIRAGIEFDGLRAHPRFAEVLAKLDASEVSH
jgi:tetratricopeptide (TPR) repeat protein